MDNLELKNILITFLQDNEKEINRALKEIEKLDSEYEIMEFESLQTEINNREKMRDNANKFLKKMENEFTIFKDEMAFIDNPKYLLDDEFINNMGELLIKQRKTPIKVGMTIQNFED